MTCRHVRIDAQLPSRPLETRLSLILFCMCLRLSAFFRGTVNVCRSHGRRLVRFRGQVGELCEHVGVIPLCFVQQNLLLPYPED